MKKVFVCICSYFYFLVSFCNYYPQDTTPTKAIRNIVYIYDTVRTEKIIYQYDTIWVADTIKAPVETVQQPVPTASDNTLERNAISGSLPRYFNVYAGSNNQTNFYSQNTGFESKKAERPLPGMSVGMSVTKFYTGRFNMSIGLECMSLREKVNYPSISRIDSNLTYNVTYHDNWGNDTIGKFFMRSGIDTVWYFITKYVNHPYADSIATTSYDTILVRQLYRNTNKMIYLNVPLSFGWNFKLSSQMGISLQTGIVMGILYQSKGNIPGLTDQGKYISLSTPALAQFILSSQLGIALNYKLPNGILLYVQPVTYYTFNSIYSDSYSLTKKYLSSIIRVGISIPVN